MDAWLEAFRDPLFLPFAVGINLVSAGAFLVFALPMTLVAATDPPALRRYRIQSRRMRAQDLVAPSVRAFVINNLLACLLVVLVWPVIRLSGIHGGPPPPWYVIVGQLVFFVYLDDFLYYWVHRAMHRGFLWKHVHSVHHRIHTPWAITGHYMHPVEYLTTASLMLVGPLLVGAHLLPIFLWVAIRQWEAAEGHCGYDVPWSPTHLFPGSDGALHHDYHHAKVKGNYAGFFAWVDRAFGTFAKGYEAVRATRRAPPPSPGSEVG